MESVNQHLISLGTVIHDAIRQYAIARREVWRRRPYGIDENLQGACVMGSYLLWLEAQKSGIECQMILGWRHAFIKHEGLLYDPTFVQFTKPCHQLPNDNDPKLQVWHPDQIPSHIAHRYKSDYTTTQETLDYINQEHSDEALDGYQLHWLSATSAHVSWFGDGVCINPMH